jgi:hypothetical protein
VKNFVSIFSISLFLLIVGRCNPFFEHKDEKNVVITVVKKDFEAKKERLAMNLRDCSDKIDRRIKNIDGQMSKSDQQLKKSLTDFRTRLIREKSKVDGSIKDIERSSEQNWQKVNKKATEVLTNAKIETQKIEERVEDLFTN